MKQSSLIPRVTEKVLLVQLFIKGFFGNISKRDCLPTPSSLKLWE
jgi:hypothetical protein